MKNISNIILSLTFIIFTGVVKSQGYHYYSTNSITPITLAEDSTSIIVIFQDSCAYKNDSARFIHPSIIELNIDKEEDTTYTKLVFDSKIYNIETWLADTFNLNINNDLVTYSYGMVDDSGYAFNPINEVLFALKDRVSYDDLKYYINLYSADSVELIEDMFVIRTNNIEDAFELSEALFLSDSVLFSHPNSYIDIDFSSDPYYPDQFNLNNTGQNVRGVIGVNDIDIDAPEAWAITKGSSIIRVCIIDVGVEEHEDIANLIDGYTPGLGTNGKPAGGGYHGQNCAGIVAATHNDLGGRGVSPNVTIASITISKKNGNQKNIKKICKGINYGWKELKCDVMNMSWGLQSGADWNDAMNNAIQNARLKGRTVNGVPKGTIVVAATGNDGGSNPGHVSFPATANGVIGVGNIGSDGVIWTSSSWGGPTTSGGEVYVDLVAPSGHGVSTTKLNDEYDIAFNGTSAAAPQVAAVAALLLSVDNELEEEEVMCRLQITSTDVGPLGYENVYGFGIVNAHYAIAINNMNIFNENIRGVQKYSTKHIMSAGPNCILENTANVELKAGDKIVLNPGFYAKAGAYLSLKITTTGPCGEGSTGAGPYRLNTHSDIKPQVNAIKNNTEEQLFNLYPNPTSGKLIVEGLEKEIKKIHICNMLGSIVYSELCNENYTKLNIDFSNFPQGVYMIEIEKDNGEYYRYNIVKF